MYYNNFPKSFFFKRTYIFYQKKWGNLHSYTVSNRFKFSKVRKKIKVKIWK